MTDPCFGRRVREATISGRATMARVEASPHSDSPQDQSVSMQYNVQYLDGSKAVIGELSVDTAVILKFISDRNWPPGAVRARCSTRTAAGFFP